MSCQQVSSTSAQRTRRIQQWQVDLYFWQPCPCTPCWWPGRVQLMSGLLLLELGIWVFLPWFGHIVKSHLASNEGMNLRSIFYKVPKNIRVSMFFAIL